jgi:hypothetical protein
MHQKTQYLLRLVTLRLSVDDDDDDDDDDNEEEDSTHL